MCDSYIVAAALDGGTQVISFILNFAVFGASGQPHIFPEWWGNGMSCLFLERSHLARVDLSLIPALSCL